MITLISISIFMIIVSIIYSIRMRNIKNKIIGTQDEIIKNQKRIIEIFENREARNKTLKSVLH